MLLVVGVVVYVERGMRRIPVQYAKRMAGRHDVRGPGHLLPDEGEHLGRDPAHLRRRACCRFPATLGNWFPFLRRLAARASRATLWIYNGVFVLLIIFFAYFYTALTFRPDDVADNIKKQGGYIPGIRPGRQTAEFIERVLNRHHLRRRASTWPPSA